MPSRKGIRRKYTLPSPKRNSQRRKSRRWRSRESRRSRQARSQRRYRGPLITEEDKKMFFHALIELAKSDRSNLDKSLRSTPLKTILEKKGVCESTMDRTFRESLPVGVDANNLMDKVNMYESAIMNSLEEMGKPAPFTMGADIPAWIIITKWLITFFVLLIGSCPK